MNGVISIGDFAQRADIDNIINGALALKKAGWPDKKVADKKIAFDSGSGFNSKGGFSTKGLVMASLFFENSTRTRISHELAAQNLGLEVNGLNGAEGSSLKKGESLKDTAQMLVGYNSKIIVLRHSLEGSSRFLSELFEKKGIPVINAGDGSNNHPTQTLLDLTTIKERKGKLDALKIVLVGDSLYGRTANGFLQAGKYYDFDITIVSPENLMIPKWKIDDYEKATGKKIKFIFDLKKALKTADVAYVMRIQKERFPEANREEEFEKARRAYHIDKALLDSLDNPELMVLHPLPRNKNALELSTDVDDTSFNSYFEQAKNGLFVRAFLIKELLTGTRYESSSFVDRIKPLNSFWIDKPIINGTKQGQHFIYRIEEGTLIDHLPAGQGLNVYKLLGFDKLQTPSVIAPNIHSESHGSKDVIGIPDLKLTREQLKLLSLIVPDATVNYISSGKVIKKGFIALPMVVDGLITCPNPKCITNPSNNEGVTSRFYQQDIETFRCHYCERPIALEEIRANLIRD